MGGGKKGGGSNIPPQLGQISQELTQLGEEQIGLALPLLQGGAQVVQDIQQTGTSKSLIPFITSAIEQSRTQQSKQLEQLFEGLTRRGITGTAFQQAMAQGRLGAESASAGIPLQTVAPILEASSSQALGLTEQGLSQLGIAGSILGGVPRGGGGGGGKGASLGGLLGTAAGIGATIAFPPAGGVTVPALAGGAGLGGTAGGLLGGLF